MACGLLQTNDYGIGARQAAFLCVGLILLYCVCASSALQNHYLSRSAGNVGVVTKAFPRLRSKQTEEPASDLTRAKTTSRSDARAPSTGSRSMRNAPERETYQITLLGNLTGDMQPDLHRVGMPWYMHTHIHRKNMRSQKIPDEVMPSEQTVNKVRTVSAEVKAPLGKRTTDQPGAVRRTANESDHLVLSTAWISSCYKNSTTAEFFASSGEIHGDVDPRLMKKGYSKCELHVKVPNGRRAAIHLSNITCTETEKANNVDFRLNQDDGSSGKVTLFQHRFCSHLPSPLNLTVYTAVNSAFVLWLTIFKTGTLYPFSFTVTFTSLPDSHRILHVEMDSPLNGSVSTPGWDGMTLSYLSMNTWVELTSPGDHEVFVSILHVDLEVPRYCYRYGYSCSLKSFLGLYRRHPATSEPIKVHCGVRKPVPSGYALPTNILYVRFVSRHIVSDDVLRRTGFKLYFSFHPRAAMLTQCSSDGAWNCSVAQWAEFRHHFPCNLQTDCVAGEDEALCPYLTPDCAGNGQFGAARRCYLYTVPKTEELSLKRTSRRKGEKLSWTMAEERCRKEGGHLASFNSYSRVRVVVDLFHSLGLYYKVFIGMVPSAVSLPNIYRHMWKHMDTSISHYMGAIDMQQSCHDPINSAVLSYHTLYKIPVKDNHGKLFGGNTILKTYRILGENRQCLLRDVSTLCEVPAASTSSMAAAEQTSRSADVTSHPRIQRLRLENRKEDQFMWDADSYWRCPRGHMTHASLACDVDSRCWADSESGPAVPCRAPAVTERLRVAPPALTCDNSVQHVPYSLVCDHRPDCHDHTDEDFCVFAPCDVLTHFECSNRACLPLEKTCDGVAHCVDASDERQCGLDKDMKTKDTKVKDEQVTLPALPPAVLIFDGEGRSKVLSLSHKLLLSEVPASGTLIKARLKDVTLAGETLVNASLTDGDVVRGTLVSGVVVSGVLAEGTLVSGHRTDNGTLVSRLVSSGLQVRGILVSGALVKATLTKGSLVGGSVENVTLTGGTATCPDTHFLCGPNDYCVPVFTRCNDVYDCPGHQDEAGCENYQCPGYYRCRGASACLHRRHLCDGVIHCPQNDDEILCDVACPDGCTCYGLSFFCSRKIAVALYPGLRYLDASGSGIRVKDLENNAMLIYVSLVRCDVGDWGPVTLPNLRGLDLSFNNITQITSGFLRHLPNLRHLKLAHNRLTSVFVSDMGSSRSFLSLRSLDMSGVFLPKLDVTVLSVFPGLRVLNLTGCGVDRVLGDGFQLLRQLRVLDSRGCPLTFFPRLVFRGLGDLTLVHADNYKLCCPETLPDRFYLSNCNAPSDEISSCDALLRSDFFRICLSVIAVFSCVGNLLSLVFRARFGRRNKRITGFEIFVANLCVSDFLMGVYLAIIGVADRLYMGTYLWNDVAWRHSAACEVAGVLSLVSSEVSAFVICLITLDRFLVLRFPFSQLRFNRAKAFSVSVFVWAVCVVIATVPLLPVTSHWQFYSQTGICIPLPITRKVFKGHVYSFSVMIVLNFVLFLMVAAGQLLVYLSVQKHKMPSLADSPSVFSKDQTLARRLITVAVSDFLCWFPIGLVGIMAADGYQVPGKLNVVMAIFVLPLNSAINPFLYTLNIVLEKLRVSREKRIRQLLLLQLNAQNTQGSGPTRTGNNCTQQETQSHVKL